jgi:hypothetical protein
MISIEDQRPDVHKLKGNTMEEMSESAVRHRAKRSGFIVRKSRTRNPDAIDYGGFTLIDDRNVVVLGGGSFPHSSDLGEIADWLMD